MSSGDGELVRSWPKSAVVGMGRARSLCPSISGINLFSYGEGVIDLDAEITDRALDLGMPEQKLHRP